MHPIDCPTLSRRLARRLLLGLALAGLMAASSAAQAKFPHEEGDLADDPATLVILYAESDARDPRQVTQMISAIGEIPAALLNAINLTQHTSRSDTPRIPPQTLTRLAMAESGGNIAVVYPDIGEPYRSVFIAILKGIEANAKAPVISLALSPGMDAASLRTLLKAQDVRVVIALGRQGMQAVDALTSEFGVVVGGVVTVPEEATQDRAVICLSPDPALLFARLKNLAPTAQRIHVVYDPKQNNWLIRLAKAAAHNQGLELVPQEAHDLQSAVRFYRDILAHANEQHDVIWLPQDPTTVEESVVLPLILQEAWARRLPVFSSSFGHVKRGVLFSLYPDNAGLGRNLLSSALDYLSKGAPGNRGIAPLQDVQLAVNLRTAKHLGLRFSSQQERSFNTVFAEQ